MTREEAIKVIKVLFDNPLFSDLHRAAFNIAIHDIKARHDWDINNLILINKDNYEPLEQEPTTKNDLGVDCIDRAELLKAMDTWDKFGYTTRYGLERLDKDDKGFVPYVKYDDMVNCVKGMPSVTPQEPILDKLRAEIDKIYEREGNSVDCLNALNELKWFIDKYKAESEET